MGKGIREDIRKLFWQGHVMRHFRDNYATSHRLRLIRDLTPSEIMHQLFDDIPPIVNRIGLVDFELHGNYFGDELWLCVMASLDGEKPWRLLGPFCCPDEGIGAVPFFPEES